MSQNWNVTKNVNSMSKFHANLVHWNSLHPINAILPTFLGQTPHFLCENEKNRTDNLHHRKAWSVAVILSLRVGVQHIQKVGQYFLQRGGSRMYTVSCKASYRLRDVNTKQEVVWSCLHVISETRENLMF